MNLKKSRDSTGFEPMTSAMPVQCSNQLSYKVTQECSVKEILHMYEVRCLKYTVRLRSSVISSVTGISYIIIEINTIVSLHIVSRIYGHKELYLDEKTMPHVYVIVSRM